MARKLLKRDEAVGRTVEDVRLLESDMSKKGFILFDDNTALVLRPSGNPAGLKHLSVITDYALLSLDEQYRGRLKSVEEAQKEAEHDRKVDQLRKEKQERAELARLKAKYE